MTVFYLEHFTLFHYDILSPDRSCKRGCDLQEHHMSTRWQKQFIHQHQKSTSQVIVGLKQREIGLLQHEQVV